MNGSTGGPAAATHSPTLEDVSRGRVSADLLGLIHVEQLLHRRPLMSDAALMGADVTGKVIVVTGGGGSIGCELCRQIMALGPKSLVVIDQCEFNLFAIEGELRRLARHAAIEPRGLSLHCHLSSVTDAVRMDQLLARHRPDTIYHAAACKHVPIVEHNEAEGAEVNVLGTLRVAEAAIRHGVAKVVLVSTDKAVRPTSVMGATKRMGELVLQALQAEVDAAGGERGANGAANRGRQGQRTEHRTVFTMVRLGNVLGSSGSVVPIFRDQIARGDPVTVTHPEATRFFMTAPEAVQLILQAGAMARGGETFVVDMGDPIRILDLARAMIILARSGVDHAGNPTLDESIEFTGLRPGEKLREDPAVDTQAERTAHPSIMVMRTDAVAWHDIHASLQRLEHAVRLRDDAMVRDILADTVGGPIGRREAGASARDADPVDRSRPRS